MPTQVLASTNREQLAYIPETDFGVIPVAGNPFALRQTGEGLTFNVTKENDKEISPDGQLTSSTTTGAQADGDIKVHVQYAEYDRFLASTLRSAWAVFGVNGVGATFGTTTVTAGTMGTVASVITASSATAGASIWTNLKPGQWFRLNMPAHVNDGKLCRVSASVAPTTTVLTLDVNTPLAVAGVVAGCSISTSRLTNGVTLQSFTIEKQMLDVNQFHTYRGMHPSKFSTSFASKQLTEGTFTFLGKDMLTSGTGQTLTTTRLPGTIVASQAYDIQNAVTGVGNIWENGAPLASTFIKSMSLDIDSGLRVQDAIGFLGAVGIGIGTFVAKGSLEVYFADGAMFQKFLNDVYTSITLSTKDAAGNGYVFTFPRVMLTSAKVVAGGKDSDLMASFEYTAYADKPNANATLRQTVFIDRFGAAVV